MRVLILCTGNSCRSQIAQSFNSDLEVHSAGTEPADKVNPKAIEVMKEFRRVRDEIQEKFKEIFL